MLTQFDDTINDLCMQKRARTDKRAATEMCVAIHPRFHAETAAEIAVLSSETYG